MFLFGDDYFLEGKNTAKTKKILTCVFESNFHHSEVKTRMFYLTGPGTNT